MAKPDLFQQFLNPQERAKTYYFDTGAGKYGLWVMPGAQEFFLWLPDQKQPVYDSFIGAKRREFLYESIGNGVYEWVLYIKSRIDEASGNDEFQKEQYHDSTVAYELQYNPENGRCMMYYPERFTWFYVDDLYLANPDLPILKEGELNDFIRRILTEAGLTPPEMPYVFGYKAEPK